METANVLFIGRTQTNGSSVANALKKHYSVLLASSGKQGLKLAMAQVVRVMVLDAVSMRTPGDRICNELRDALPAVPLVHMHPGPKEAAQSKADVLLIHPVTSRKLLNVLDRLLQAREDDLVICGPFTMNRSRRLLIVDGLETQLTPKQALLVETFLTSPGVTLDRRTLMEKVWQTDYLGDTRTLDVHIRWIREMIEVDPSRPQYLQTVRGVGYRLEIPL